MDKRRPYGVGLAYRSLLHREVLQHAADIDLLEIPTEDYIVRSRRLNVDPDGRLLREALERFPAVAHGIRMSVGSVERLDEVYLERTEQLLREFGIEDFSEHLAYHRMSGTDVHMFLCLPFEEVSLRPGWPPSTGICGDGWGGPSAWRTSATITRCRSAHWTRPSS